MNCFANGAIEMDTIEELLTPTRLSKYGLTKPRDALRYHTYNIELSETFYPSIIHFEIVLRNKVDKIFSKYLGDNWIFDSSLLTSRSFAYVQEAQRRLHNNGKDSADKNFIISELTLGFWTSFFMEEYKAEIWAKFPKILEEIFNKAKNPKLAEKRAVLNHIRNFRNKMFHASSIIHPNLRINPEQTHNLIYTNLKALGAQAIIREVSKIDRFKSIYHKGIEQKIIMLNKA